MTSIPSGSRSKFAVFRTDASPEIGAGHLMRCQTLADELFDRGWRCAFALESQAGLLISTFKRSRHDIIELDDALTTQSKAMRMAWPNGCDLLVVDHYDLDWKFEDALNNWAKKIFVIDDLANRRHACDLLLDQTLGRKSAAYEELAPDNTVLMLGSAYALLRPQFFQQRLKKIYGHASVDDEFNIFIGFGATDPSNATEKALRALCKIERKIEVDVALSSAAPHLEQIQILTKKLPFPVNLHLDKDDMAALFSRMDLAIGAGGSTAWERCCLGLPSVIMVTADNQKKTAKELDRSGAALAVGRDNEIVEEDIARVTNELLSTPEKLNEMYWKSSAVCDGLGVKRVVQSLDPQSATDRQDVRLRPVTMADSEIILDWQKAPETRRYARNPENPERDKHFSWMRAKLDDVSCIFNMIEHDNKSAGVIRLDRLEDREHGENVFEISIFTDPQKYRQGIAWAALQLVRDLVPSVTLAAHVHQENQASANLFLKAGYQSNGEWFYSQGGM